MNTWLFRPGVRLVLALALLMFSAAACQTPPSPATPTQNPPTATPASAPAAPEEQAGGGSETGGAAPAQTEENASAGTTGQADESFAPMEPLAPEEASPPSRVQIPAIGLDAPVEPIGWRITEFAGTRTTVWALPDASAGWHPTSGMAGARGNVVISGHQLLGEAVFAPLALGQVEVGQDVLLTDNDGRTFVYRVTEVSEPEPISSDLDKEAALADQYTAQGEDAILTLISGWPDYTTTHRIFVTATFMGVGR